MNRNYADIKTNVANNIQDTSSATDTIIGVYVNDVYVDLLRRVKTTNFIREYSFSTTAGTKDYALPRNFLEEMYVFDSTNKWNLERITLQERFQSYGENFGSNGSAERYAILDFPADSTIDSTTITVVSSSASDTTQTVRVTGLVAGVQLSEDITLTGTSNATSTNTFTSLISISKSATTTGYITVTDGSTTIAVMSPKDKDYRAKIIRLIDTPSDTVTMNVGYKMRIEPMSDDNDTPLIDAADIIELGATSKAWRYKRQFDKAKDYEVLYEKSLMNFVFDVESQMNEVHRFNYVPYERAA